ncbi:MAG TPA: hypothetical protein VFK80_06445, partial [Limnochordia bacterium]|nr:hypothetical protein [Limnochordia bacterium]
MLCLMLAAAACGQSPARAALAAPAAPAAADAGRILLLVVDRLSAPEFFAALPELPHLRAATAHGALGLLNTRAADRNPLSGFLSLGSGYHLVAPDGAGSWLPVTAPMAGTTAGQLYTSLTGQPAPAPDGYVWPGAAALGAENRAAPAPPGGMGEALARAGITPFVIGNADLPGSPRRGAALIAMDGAGRLAAGSLETGARRGDDPYLVQDDPAALWSGAAQALATHRLVVVEMGDLARLADAELSIAPAVAERARAGALQRVDAFVGAWLAGSQPGDRLLMVSPNPAPGDAARGHTLTAALWVEAGRDLHAALLTSATTHRA